MKEYRTVGTRTISFLVRTLVLNGTLCLCLDAVKSFNCRIYRRRQRVCYHDGEVYGFQLGSILVVYMEIDQNVTGQNNLSSVR